MAKRYMVKGVSFVVKHHTVSGMMPAVRVADDFCKEIQKVKQYDDDSRFNEDVEMMAQLVRKMIVMKWVDKIQHHLNTNTGIIDHTPKNFAAIVSTQVTASINQGMFTKAKVLLMQAIDVTVDQHEFFKKLGLVQLGAEDELFVAQ